MNAQPACSQTKLSFQLCVWIWCRTRGQLDQACTDPFIVRRLANTDWNANWSHATGAGAQLNISPKNMSKKWLLVDTCLKLRRLFSASSLRTISSWSLKMIWIFEQSHTLITQPNPLKHLMHWSISQGKYVHQIKPLISNLNQFLFICCIKKLNRWWVVLNKRALFLCRITLHCKNVVTFNCFYWGHKYDLIWLN